MNKRQRKKILSRPVEFSWSLRVISRLDIGSYIGWYYDSNLIRIRRKGPSRIGIAHKPKKPKRGS